MAKNRKATKKFQKKQLKQTIEKRRNVQKFKKSVDRRQFKKKLSATKNSENKKESELSENLQTEQKLSDSDDELGLKEINDLALSDSSKETLEEEGIENFQISDGSEESDVINDSKDQNNRQPKSHKQKLSLQKDVLELKKQLEELKEKDPKFHKYLIENDQELIEFDVSDFDSDSGSEKDYSNEESIEENNADIKEAESNNMELDSENEDVDDEEEEEKAALREAGLDDDYNERVPELTSEMIDKWILAMTESNSLSATHALVLAFRAAAHINEDEAVQSFAYRVSDPLVFNNLMVVGLKHIPDVFDHHLRAKDSGNPKSICAHRKWKSMQTLVKSFLNSVIFILKQLTEKDTLFFIIKESEKLIPYYSCFPKLAGQYLKVLLQHWGTSEDKVRVVAFINIRKLALTAPSPFIDLCLKGIYSTFVQYCKETSVFTITSINLMSNCAVEIFGLDFKRSYQSAFGYIRQLAIHLRNSMNMKSEETFSAVYNWQYIHCIELWSKVLATYCDEQSVASTGQSSLQELIYPFVQVCIGTGTFIPLAPYLFEILHSAEVCRNAKPSTSKPLDFTIYLKAPKSYLRTTVYQDGVCEELTELLLEYYASFCLSIAFPELIIPAVFQIKRFIKASKNFKINKKFQQLVLKLEENGKFIEQHRKNVEFGPGDIEKAKSFLRDVSKDSTPLGSYANTLRKLKEQRRKLMETN
ncbi:11287_t:CDS:10 [Funneliformis caledonium]|uniref:11287_t:CDS:1 n=1 Tax=Funneliformis caledonium TaxID=1117310 RepID=A0A9N8YXF5_9GLOM|nr:11287_t:CDS:10 [Funneliformis caledonium]